MIDIFQMISKVSDAQFLTHSELSDLGASGPHLLNRRDHQGGRPNLAGAKGEHRVCKGSRVCCKRFDSLCPGGANRSHGCGGH